MNLPKKVFPFLVYFIRQQWIKFVIAVIASACWGAYSSFFPYLLKRLINVLDSHEMTALEINAAAAKVVGLIVFLFIGSQLLLRVQGILFSVRFCATFRANIRETLFNYVQTHSSSYFANNFSGTIAGKISDVPTSCEIMLTSICCEFTSAIIMALIAIVTMWLSHPLFAELLIFWLVLHFVTTFFFLKKANSLLEHHAGAVTTLSGKIVDVFTNIQNMKLFAREKYEREYLHHFQNEEIKCSKQAYGFLEWMQTGFFFNETFLMFGMLFLLMRGWQQHSVSLGDFTQIMMQAFWLSAWMWYVSYQMRFFIKNAATVNSALSLIQQPHDVVDAPGAASLKVSRGEIYFEDVSFSYHQQPVFQNLNVTIHAGEKVGIVGLSGAGKTTFMNLILRLYELNAGKILIDGESIAGVTQQSLHENIAVIPQEPLLFHRTLMENIRYGRLEASDEEVLKASRQAHCHEFVEQLSAKYETLVGERGIKLSGGQRQRIAIARALLKDAPILILDEATSSLDSMTEKKIQEGLHSLMRDRTTIVIAHRLSTLAAMDRILVFHEGNIVEDGTIQELLHEGNHFAMLWKMQQEGSTIDD